MRLSFIISLFFLCLKDACSDDIDMFNLQENEQVCTYIIPLRDQCIDRVVGAKVYLKDIYVLHSNRLCCLYTNSYGRLELKNILRDERGYYLPKIMISMPNHGECSFHKVSYPFQLCSNTEEVNKHLGNALEHGLTAAAAMTGAVAAAVTGNPAVATIGKGAALFAAGKTAKDLKQAYDKYTEKDKDVDNSRGSSNRDRQRDSPDYFDRNSR